MMQPFGASERTIFWCAKEGIIPWVLNAHPESFRHVAKVYMDSANAEGQNLKLGQSLGAVRAVHFGETEEAAVRLLARTNFESFNKVFGAFGFFEAHRAPEDAAKYPLDPYTPLPPEEWTVDRLRRVKYAIAGTPDQVKYMIDDLHKMHQGDGELEWFGWFFDQGLMSWEEQERQLEMFAKHIIPAFGD